jgi:hypothetical protein
MLYFTVSATINVLISGQRFVSRSYPITQTRRILVMNVLDNGWFLGIPYQGSFLSSYLASQETGNTQPFFNSFPTDGKLVISVNALTTGSFVMYSIGPTLYYPDILP